MFLVARAAAFSPCSSSSSPSSSRALGQRPPPIFTPSQHTIIAMRLAILRLTGGAAITIGAVILGILVNCLYQRIG